MTPLSLAFLPLTDSAPLIVAAARGFAAEAGIELDLVRTTSWATLRDRLVYGQVQGAHMLAPLAIAVTLGLEQVDVTGPEGAWRQQRSGKIAQHGEELAGGHRLHPWQACGMAEQRVTNLPVERK